MSGYVTTVPPTPAEPKQTVTLELGVEEFAMLENLRHNHLGGSGDVRNRIDDVFATVRQGLSVENLRRVNTARTKSDEWNSVVVSRVFSL